MFAPLNIFADVMLIALPMPVSFKLKRTLIEYVTLSCIH